ncbi:MAG: FHA domain-containing protein, partial [Williamsia herbipolensis]|nr:FHA domain-containing protein [Williamsia herbipolensis]
DDDDVDGDTVLRPPAAVSSPGATADRVASIRDRDRGLQAVQQAPARVPSIRIAGTVHRLDRPVIVGRRPALPRVVRGTPPELVTVPSRRSEVSSSHLMVRAEGDAVVVEDLGSTNGTVVRPPGAAPTRMPSGASIVVLTGTVVEIGDGNTIEILSPYLRLQPPQHGADRTVPWPSAPEPRNAPQPESDPDT